MFNETNRHYSLRKLSVGLASVLIGISFASSMSGNSVKADTVNGDSNSAQTVKVNDTVAKGSDAVVKTDAESAPEGQNQTPEAVKKDSGVITQDIKQKAVKASEAVAKLQNNAVKDNSDAKNTADDSKAAVKDAAESTSKGTNLAVKQQNTAAQGSDAVGDKALKANNSSVVQEDSSAKNDSLTAKNNALKATVEAAKQGLETPVVPHADGNEAALLTTTGKKFNAQMLFASKIMSPANDTNGGFDSSWGTLNVNDWKGSVQGDYYQLTNYTGDTNHVIVPNEADFEKAGISTSGKQVGVTSSLMHIIFADKATATDVTVAFSKTNNKMVKAIGSNWSHTWDSQDGNGAILSKIDGTNLDVSNVTDMSYMFNGDSIAYLSSLANWNVSNVIDMSYMFNGDTIDNLKPLANWKVDNVTNMSEMFDGNRISNLKPLANWNVNNVTNMSYMFIINRISDLSPLVNWKVDNVTDMNSMFYGNQISDLSPLANWKVDNVTDMIRMFSDNQISDLSPLANWNVNSVTNMRMMFAINKVSDLSSLDNWKVDNVTDMSSMFYSNQISDLSPLANWKVDNVTDMSSMFYGNQISDLSPLANWKVDNVTDMIRMFSDNQISDLSPLANWHTNNVINMVYMFLDNQISDLSPLANWDTSKVNHMNGMFENTPLKKVTLTNWDFSNVNVDPSNSSVFPDTNFEAILSDKTSKSLLDLSSKLSDSVKENIKDKQDELKQVEQEYQYYLTGDGKKEYDGSIQDLQEQFNQDKQKIQQEINQVKLQAEYPLNSVFGNHSKITTPNRDLLVYLVGKLPVKSDTATRTIEITFPDGTKKTINQSVGYGKYAISGTADMATHKLDMAMPYELSKWELVKKEDGSYDLVKAHVDKNGVASFDDIQLPKIPGYKTVVKTASSPVNHANARFAVSFMALPKPVTPAINDAKPDKTVSPATPAATEAAELIKTEAKAATSAAKVIDLSNDAVAVTPKMIDLSDDAVVTTPKKTTWHVADEPSKDTYHVSNGKYTVELPHISNAQLHVIANDSTKDTVLFTYKGQNNKYVFKIKFANGHYLLTTYKIKSGKLVKLIDYNFIKSSKMIDVILDWLQLK